MCDVYCIFFSTVRPRLFFHRRRFISPYTTLDNFSIICSLVPCHHYWFIKHTVSERPDARTSTGLAAASLGVFVKPPISNSSQQAALAHLGERQTEVHFTSSCIRSILEALCSIHRSGIDVPFVPLTLSQWPSLLPGFWLFCDSPWTPRLGIINP